MSTKILVGDCREVLKTLPEQSVQCVVTSPPYYGLRQYLPTGHPDADKEIGLEQTPEAYVAEMVEVFREVWRVLRDDGTVWLNIGDSYNNFRVSKGPGQAVHGRDKLNGKPAPDSGRRGWSGAKEKDLIGIPWMLAFALRADGWYLRRDIVWSKPNPMPESVTDRPTTAHEYVFLLTKRSHYFYDSDAVREASDQPDRVRYDKVGGASHDERQQHSEGGLFVGSATRNLRSVWTIATRPFTGSHFATMPPDLAERCMAAGSSERGCCQACGAPWERIVTKGEPDAAHRAACGADTSGGYNGHSTKNHKAAGVQDASDVKRRILDGMRERTYDWQPSCSCEDARVVPCTVLDPFGGAGTTALVADRMGRDCIIIELNPEYAEIARRRIEKDSGLFAQVAAQ